MKTMKNTKAWANYCRQNNLKNLGKGKAARVQGYDVTTLELQPDGSVLGDNAPQPDDILRTQLKDAFTEIQVETLPMMPVPPAAGMPPIGNRPGFVALHEYRGAEGELLMCVERFIRPDGDKQCLPWFYFQDEGWACRDAPDGFLSPLYGNHHKRSRVMIHEGEKAVDAAIAACAHDSAHPWASFLRLFGHCTWRGGAIMGAVGRADWNELENCSEIYIMPDNDKDGYEAAKKVRNRLRAESVHCVHWRTFGDVVPRKWDIADPCPAIPVELLAESFELYEQATEKWWDDAGKVHTRLRPEFAKKFSLIVRTGELVENRRPTIYYDTQLFNRSFARFSDVTNLADLMYRSDDVHKYSRPGYNPGLSLGSLGEYVPPPRFGRARSDGQSFVNMYRQPLIQEKAPGRAKAGKWLETRRSLRPFIVYATKVFPIARERKTLIRWLCHNLTVSHPEDRAHWATLLISRTEGTGKSTLGLIAKRLIGEHNSTMVEGTVLTDKFTSWLENIQLVLIEEIKEESAFRLSESLKAKITQPTVSIRRMNTDAYETDNFMTLLASSNHMSALSLSDRDRRWFIPTVTESLVPWNKWQARHYLAMPKNDYDDSFFREFWNWFNAGGEQTLLWFMRRYGLALQQRGWAAENNRAPLTEVKASVIQRSKGEWQAMIESELGEEDAVCIQDVFEWFKENKVRSPRADAIGDFLETIGLTRMYKDLASSDIKIRAGRVYLLKKDGGGYITGHIHGRNPAEPRSSWTQRKQGHRWLSDKFKGLALMDLQSSAGAPKTEEEAVKAAPF